MVFELYELSDTHQNTLHSFSVGAK